MFAPAWPYMGLNGALDEMSEQEGVFEFTSEHS